MASQGKVAQGDPCGTCLRSVHDVVLLQVVRLGGFQRQAAIVKNDDHRRAALRRNRLRIFEVRGRGQTRQVQTVIAAFEIADAANVRGENEAVAALAAGQAGISGAAIKQGRPFQPAESVRGRVPLMVSASSVPVRFAIRCSCDARAESPAGRKDAVRRGLFRTGRKMSGSVFDGDRVANRGDPFSHQVDRLL